MLYMNGESPNYRLRRVAKVYGGILNSYDPRVCVQVKPNLNKRKIRGIQNGDILGKVYSVAIDDDLGSEHVMVMNGGISE